MSDDRKEERGTKRVAVAYSLDDGPPEARIGLICLMTDLATERDFHRMLPDEGVMFYTARVRNVNPVTVENLRMMGPHLSEAASQLLPDFRIDAVAYSCTSATVALGYDEVRAQIHAGRPTVPVVTPITAAVAAARSLGMKRLSMLTPYVDSVSEPIRAYLEHNGIEVLNVASFGLESDVDMARIPPDAIHAAALEACHDDADGLFISCTALRAVEVIDALERTLKKPVISSVQCLFWQSLREAGYRKFIDGFGKLLRA
jgi:maleate isomerase